MTRLRGRTTRGLRAPAGHWCVTTMISSIRLDETTTYMTINAATDTDIFRAYVLHILTSTLKPGDVVIMDNLSSHMNAETTRLIQGACTCVGFLPAYSPDFNPIEKMWRKVKGALHSAKARTQKGLLKKLWLRSPQRMQWVGLPRVATVLINNALTQTISIIFFLGNF